MRKINFIMLILFALVLFSCGKKEENNSEFTDEKVGEPNVKTEEPSRKDSSTEPENKPSEQQKKQTDTLKSKGNGELKFYSREIKPEAVISPLQAKDHIGRVVAVKGFVADVYKTEKVAYLNFVEKFPDNPFSGVIFANKFKDFGDMNIYEGKNVELTGRVTAYKEKPQIILDSPEQIKIIQ